MTSTTDNTNADEAQSHDRIPSTPGGWMRAAAYRRYLLTREYAAGLGDTAREGISDEDYATTMATLETMARNLGWTEGQGRPDWSPGAPWGRPGYGHYGHYGPRCGRGFAGHRGEARGKKSRDKAEKKAAKRTGSA